MATKKKKGKWIVKLLKVVVIAYLLLILCQLINDAYSRLSFTHEISVSEEWNLIIVNRWNELPEDYSVELTELSNGQKVDSRIYPYLQEMFDAARAEGIYPVVREGYRTAEEQQEILDDKIQTYINQGYSQSRAERTAKEWVALPGTSEHQLGIAVDINADKSKCSNEDVYAWLAENAYKYGFILRYPPGKQEIIGTSYEPWHYRYVGIEAAYEINERGICLEEYFE
ncbi:MAG: M15 family metallopeptidase [Lachnospiraceae bacterium]|nr:M15 family metallopeptidase [Lachnospiraceae bacterium]